MNAVPPNITGWQKFVAWWSTTDRPHKVAVIVTVVLIVGVFAVAVPLCSKLLTQDRINEWYGGARHAPVVTDTPALNHPASVSGEIRARLDGQLAVVRNAAHTHFLIATAFARYQFAMITIATICGVIAGVLLVFISAIGWKDAKWTLTLPFVVVAGGGIMFTSFTQLYRQAQNIADNSRLYLGYLQVEDELLSYYPIAIECDARKKLEAMEELVGVKPGDLDEKRRDIAREQRKAREADVKAGELGALTPGELVALIDKQEKELRSLAVSFDPSKVAQFKEVFDQLKPEK